MGHGWCLAAHLYMRVVDCTAIGDCRVADEVTHADVASGRPPEDCSPICRGRVPAKIGVGDITSHILKAFIRKSSLTAI